MAGGLRCERSFHAGKSDQRAHPENHQRATPSTRRNSSAHADSTRCYHEAWEFPSLTTNRRSSLFLRRQAIVAVERDEERRSSTRRDVTFFAVSAGLLVELR